MNTLKVASINIRALKSVDRVKHLLDFCLENEFDVVALQEVTFYECSLLKQYYTLLSNIGPRRLGTAMLLRKGITFSRELLEPEGRLISIDVGSVTMINVYAPSGTQVKEERNEFFRKTVPAYALTSKLPVILMGDFNCVEFTTDRSQNNCTAPSNKINRALTEMISAFELVDIWLKLEPGNKGHTFFHPKGSSRLDRVYCTRSWSDFLDKIQIQPITFSDHWCISFNVKCSTTYTMKRLTKNNWKLNTAILNEEAYRNVMIAFINNVSSHPLRKNDVLKWWEQVFKPGVKQESIRYCQNRARLRRETRIYYQECIRDLVTAPTLDWAAYQELKSYCRQWEEGLLRGCGIRSRDQVDPENEDASIFHVKKARQNGRACNIDTVISSTGTEISNRDEINSEIVAYFYDIFKNRPPQSDMAGEQFLSLVKDLFPISPHYLTEPITVFDLKVALLKTKKNKSPGTDGIPYEFYLMFWDLIAPHFLDMFKHVLERDCLSSSQGRAAIRLIPKSKGVCSISGYRPISLLNTDYKLMAAVLANRLRKSLELVIQPYQKGGVPGRLLFDNLCLYRDVIQYVDERSPNVQQTASNTGQKAGIIGVDLAKAYDLVNREVLWKIMAVMGYPQQFISWIKTMYSITEIVILNGNEVAGTLNDIQSIRQGCPLSMHLFVLYIEPLLVCLAKKLKGIEFFNNSVRVRAMVDDVVIFVSCDDDIIKAGEILDQYCDWTKAIMNKNKTKIMGIGKWKNRQIWPISWLESTTNLKLLGIPFSYNINETSARVWDSAYGHMLGLMRENASRRLTLYQRVNFSKTKILSRSVYIALVLPCPYEISHKILNALVNFVYLGKLEKPARPVSFRPIKQGGLSLTHPELFFKSLFLKNIFNSLVNPASTDNTLIRFWMGFPLRQHMSIYQGNLYPKAVIERPQYLQEPVRQIKELLDGNIIQPTKRLAHRAVYEHWVKQQSGPGKIECRYPAFDWDSIWRHTSRLPAKLKETMFLFNQRLLLTADRCHRLGLSTTETCNFCSKEPESDEHLMLQCPARRDLVSWLERTTRQFGCKTSPMEFIRGQFGPAKNAKQLMALVAAYVHTTWKERKRRRVPSEEEVFQLWKSLITC
jgi:exonuclease III